MQTKSYSIDGRGIVVFDDVLSHLEHNNAYRFAINSKYSVARSGSELPEDRSHQKTLACYMTLGEVVSQGILSNTTIKNYIKEKKLRVKDYYINLGTASDTYPYHVDDGQDIGNETLLCYLNLIWHPTWEGETHFSNDKMKEVMYTSSFIPGRVVLFDSCIPHKSSQPSFDAKHFRFVAVAKLVNSKSGFYDRGINIEDFVFDVNHVLDGISEREQKAIDALNHITGDIAHSGESLFNHLVKTFCILKTHGASTDVCLAGLYHSIYGTVYFDPNIQIDRNYVVQLIGEKAEMLVNCFCSDGDIDHKIMNNGFNLNGNDWLGLLQIYYANGIEQAIRNSFQFSNEPNKFALIKNKIEELTKENNYNE